jgi:hypothetical protein
VNPVIELESYRQFPKPGRPAADQRLLLGDPIADARAIGPNALLLDTIRLP